MTRSSGGSSRGRQAPSVFSIDAGDNRLRSRNVQTVGKVALLSPLPNAAQDSILGSPCGPFICSARLCDPPLVWEGVGTSSALSSVPGGYLCLSHSVKIQRCPTKILPTGQFRNTLLSPRKKRQQQACPLAPVPEFISYVSRQNPTFQKISIESTL